MRTLTNERRQAIIDAAADLFQEMGYERTSMNEVAKRVGGSKATLYNYFASKEALFEMVVRTYSTHFLNAAASELSSYHDGVMTFEQNLTRFGERMMEVLLTDNQALRIYRCVVAEAGKSNIGELFRAAGPQESIAKLAELMSLAMHKGELAQGDSTIRALQFTALLKAEVDSRLLEREPVPWSVAQVKNIVARGVQLFLYGAVAQVATQA
ncbi:TetR/AcrR family transcriptional regulator [Serratia sp. M24T3]|uniref:TetR/AcrR family transcriptional regulator n=1 Tax=Serratia sp. M24T3 TaxID=932213 RepID=UPI00025BA2B1|nr:TetR/AcrR family transcriptional regulator [Serratia sp. M24T3]EIC86141.1 TetR family DNA-binding transcriptional regulator [Serratia sp. M24T3]